MTGLSRTGKSTLEAKLKEKGFEVASTSAYLDIKTLEYYQIPVTPENIQALVDKNQEALPQLKGRDIRLAKIHVAEDIIVPTCGRYKGLVLPALESAINRGIRSHPSTLRIIASVFNKSELVLFHKAINSYDIKALAPIYSINLAMPFYLDRVGKLTGVDKREEIGFMLSNNGTVDELITGFHKLFNISV